MARDLAQNQAQFLALNRSIQLMLITWYVFIVVVVFVVVIKAEDDIFLIGVLFVY